jgi:hypothetical protein
LGKPCIRALAVGWLLVALPSLVRSQDVAPPEHYRLRLAYDRWFSSLDAQVKKGGDGLPGTEIDAKADLGVEDKDSNEFRAVLKLAGRHKLRASYMSLDYDGDVVLESPFLFDGTFYRAGERVVTSLKGGLWTAEYEFDVVQTGSAHLGLLVGAKYLDVDSVIVQPDEGLRETGTQRAPVPVLGASGRLYLGRISLSAEITGLTIGERGSLYDFEGQLRYHINDRIAVGGGYRLLNVRGEDDGDLIRMRIDGFRAGVELGL